MTESNMQHHEEKPRVVFFTWMKEGGGGSGVEEVARRLAIDGPDFQIAAVVSPFPEAEKSRRLQRIRALATPEAGSAPGGGVKFIAYRAPTIPAWLKAKPRGAGKWIPKSVRERASAVVRGRAFEKIQKQSGAEYVALSGFLKLVPVRSVAWWGTLLHLVGLNRGLDPRKTINIHPAPLPEVGGSGVYGKYAHEKVMELYHAGELTHSAVSMHFATARYDDGPIIFKGLVEIHEDDTPETLGKRVNEQEHKWQAYITSLVATGKISWDGVHKDSLRVPEGYEIVQRLEERVEIPR